jgi:asparagine synthase (glutamine-hydrolysing)
MCGITGFFSYNNTIDTKKYYDAHLKIAHRGPDDEGFICKNKHQNIEHLIGNDSIDELKNREFIFDKDPSSLILGHRRLSILDLSVNGHQPFVFGDLYLTYNGEIYNYLELREELKELGYSFVTECDTEVFLKAYHCWGVGAFSKFNGMWAAAIYDVSKDNILLTRDRFGIKPLYYSLIDDNLVFGSEIKFVSSFLPKLHENEQMVYEYLRFGRTDHTNQTMFKDIMQLEPNSYMVYSLSGEDIKQYWTMQDEESASRDIIEKKLCSAVNLRMRSDVEVGALLSGGIDSSTILGIIDHNKYATKFQTFSAVFSEEAFSEKKYIDQFSAKNLDLTKHYIYPKAEDLSVKIDELLLTHEEPFRSLSVLSQFEIYKFIKYQTNVTVLLNGQGADEIFTGYTEYYYVYLLELLSKCKLKLFYKELCCLSTNQGRRKINIAKSILISLLSKYYRNNDKYNIFNKKFTPIKRRGKITGLLNDSLWSSLTYSALREYLRYEDRNSMRFSLESRLPFLDYRLVQSAFSLESGVKIKAGLSKNILREIAKGKIPKETLNRKDKMGFVSPQEVWQRGIMESDFRATFLEMKQNGIFDFLNEHKVHSVYQKYQKGKFDDWPFVWRLYCIYKWKRVWRIGQ